MRLCLFVLWAGSLFGQRLVWRTEVPGEELRGAAGAYTWGTAVQRWSGPKYAEVAKAAHGYDQGGCVLPMGGVVLVERPAEGTLGRLVWLRAPKYEAEVIDTDVELQDCLAAELFGRTGFLIVHRFAQVRFYWREAGKWAVREIYSIYTAARQGGLALADVDGDGNDDIYCGNYWLRNPGELALPWRIFAINLLDEANFLLAADGERVLTVQRESGVARWFAPGDEVTALWAPGPAGEFSRPTAVRRAGKEIWVADERGVTALPGGRRWGFPAVGFLGDGSVVGPNAVAYFSRR